MKEVWYPHAPKPAYSLWDLYIDIINDRANQFTYSSETFTAYWPIDSNETIVTYYKDGVRWRAHAKKMDMQCMSDFHGLAACILHEKKEDIYFKKHDYCTKEEFYK